jgi:hypothetical protein
VRTAQDEPPKSGVWRSQKPGRLVRCRNYVAGLGLATACNEVTEVGRACARKCLEPPTERVGAAPPRVLGEIIPSCLARPALLCRRDVAAGEAVDKDAFCGAIEGDACDCFGVRPTPFRVGEDTGVLCCDDEVPDFTAP